MRSEEEYYKPCDECLGTGLIGLEPCEHCEGTGVQPMTSEEIQFHEECLCDDSADLQSDR